MQAQKCQRQRDYDLRMLHEDAIEHRSREGRLAEIQFGLNRICRPST
jgi:hypothetical protein